MRAGFSWDFSARSVGVWVSGFLGVTRFLWFQFKGPMVGGLGVEGVGRFQGFGTVIIDMQWVIM